MSAPGAAMSRPTISRTMLSWVSSSRASEPTLAPSRSTTARSATARTSPSRWRCRPLRHHRRGALRRSRAALRLGQCEARRRLVHDEQARFRSIAFAISTSCFSAIDQVGDLRVFQILVQADVSRASGARPFAHLRASSSGSRPQTASRARGACLHAMSRWSSRFSSWWISTIPCALRPRANWRTSPARRLRHRARARAARSRRGSSSASTCPRRSRRAVRRPLPACTSI